MFSQMPFSADLVQANRKHFRYEWIWEKDNATGFLNANKMPLKKHENILIFYDKLPLYHPQMTKGKPHKRGGTGGHSTNYGSYNRLNESVTDEYYPMDVIKFPRCNSLFKNDKVYHPTQKPVPLLEYLIKTYTNEGETVLDNCMGSGSTGVACVNTGREFIGIELDENYFRIAEKRINEARA